MKSLAEHMAFYSSYHRDPRNRLTRDFAGAEHAFKQARAG